MDNGELIGSNELLEKVNNIQVTKTLLDSWLEHRNQFASHAFQEFDAKSCTYSQPEPEAQYEPWSANNAWEGVNCSGSGGWMPEECTEEVTPENVVPPTWLATLSDVDKDTVLGPPRTRSEFIALKRALNELKDEWTPLEGHPEFPQYSKDLTMKWDDLLKLEEKRRRIAACEQLWKDMWENYPDEMRETMPEYVPQEEELKGLVVIYVNVGDLPTDKAELYIDKIKAKSKKLRNIPLNYGIMWLPVRGAEENKVELIRF